MLCCYSISNIHSVAATKRILVIKSEIIPTSDVSLIRGRATGLDMGKSIIFVDCDAVAFEHHISGEMPEPFLHKAVAKLTGRGITGKRYEDTLASFLSAPKHPVDFELNRLIKELQNSGAIVVFLTSCPAGKFGSIPSIAKLREKDLTDCGVQPQNWGEITIRFSELGETPMPSSIVPTDDTASVFINGICFNIFSTKGKVMEAFLNRVKRDPIFDTLISQQGVFANNFRNFRSLLQSGRPDELTVFFIDDSTKNIQDVSRACGIYGANYLGIHYTAQLEKHQHTPPGYNWVLPAFGILPSVYLKEFPPSTAKTQLKILVGQGLFLTPSDVRFLLSLTAKHETVWRQLMLSPLFCFHLGFGQTSL